MKLIGGTVTDVVVVVVARTSSRPHMCAEAAAGPGADARHSQWCWEMFSPRTEIVYRVKL